jgi:hypothetical protein
VRVSEHSVEVTVVRWPAEAATRTLLARDGRPRVLLVAGDAAAPPALDDLEDWLREPVDPVELLARTDALRRRAAAQKTAPRLDDDGLLRFDGRWVVIPDAQLPLVRLLVERFGQLVRNDELAEAYIAAGGTGNRSSIRTAITRIRVRVADVGLALESARHRGVVLDVAAPARD